MDKIILMTDVKKSFGMLEILNHVNFDLAPSDFMSIMGPSGSGKSTLLHLVGLMDHATSGQIFLQGQNTADLSDDERSRIRLDVLGFLFQFHYLLPDFDVLENILIPSRMANDDLEQKKKEALQLIEKMGLKERITHRPHELSGGEQQRVALARALIRKPKLLLCDEPTGNLDAEAAQDVMSLILNEINDRKMAAIFVTHNPDLAVQANRQFVMANKQLISK